MLTWMAVKKFLKKVWVWLRHNWYAPFLVVYTIALWIFFRRKDAAYKVLETLYSENGKLNTSVIKDIKEKVFWGYDNDSKSVARTQINMFLVGDGHVHIYETDDSLIDWKPKHGWKPNEFDYILTNPPMGQYEGDNSLWGSSGSSTDS